MQCVYPIIMHCHIVHIIHTAGGPGSPACPCGPGGPGIPWKGHGQQYSYKNSCRGLSEHMARYNYLIQITSQCILCHCNFGQHFSSCLPMVLFLLCRGRISNGSTILTFIHTFLPCCPSFPITPVNPGLPYVHMHYFVWGNITHYTSTYWISRWTRWTRLWSMKTETKILFWTLKTLNYSQVQYYLAVHQVVQEVLSTLKYRHNRPCIYIVCSYCLSHLQ